MKKAALTALAAVLLLSGCATQEFSGQTWRVQAGRAVNELFTQGTTAYGVTAEFRFDKKR